MSELSAQVKLPAINSLTLLVGTAACNANCSHCAAIPLRKFAPKRDGMVESELITKTLYDCYLAGARYLSISGCGEPTLSPLSITKTLEIVKSVGLDCIKYTPINLYSNGIIIGESRKFCGDYFDIWKNCGLTTLYITLHDIDCKVNAQIYRVSKYPPIEAIVDNIHSHDLLVRANLMLHKDLIDMPDKFSFAIEHLLRLGVDYISAWPVRNLEDKVDFDKSASYSSLIAMREWLVNSKYKNIKLLFEENSSSAKSVSKLTLFPDGTLSSSWCNNRV